jgi:hypothetical protein
MADRLPFHESILGVIPSATCMEIPILAILIKTTKIPKNHDTISKAWSALINKSFGEDYDDFGVLEDLNDQRHEAEVKTREKPLPDALDGDGR